MSQNILEIILRANDQASGKFAKVRGQLKNIGSGMAVAGTAIAAAGTAASYALFKIGQSTAAFADQVQKAGIRTGVATEFLSTMGFAAEQSGGSFADIEKGMRKLSMSAGEAADGMATYKDSFDALGVSVVNNKGELKDLDDLFLDVADGLANTENETKRAALAFEIFGRAGSNLAPLLFEGRDGIMKLREEAKALGVELTQFEADQGAKFVDAMNRMKTAMEGAKMVLGKELSPLYTDLADRITGVMVQMRPFIQANADLAVSLAKVAGYVAATGTIMVGLGAFLLVLTALGGPITLAVVGFSALAVALAKMGIAARMMPTSLDGFDERLNSLNENATALAEKLKRLEDAPLPSLTSKQMDLGFTPESLRAQEIAQVTTELEKLRGEMEETADGRQRLTNAIEDQRRAEEELTEAQERAEQGEITATLEARRDAIDGLIDSIRGHNPEMAAMINSYKDLEDQLLAVPISELTRSIEDSKQKAIALREELSAHPELEGTEAYTAKQVELKKVLETILILMNEVNDKKAAAKEEDDEAGETFSEAIKNFVEAESQLVSMQGVGTNISRILTSGADGFGRGLARAKQEGLKVNQVMEQIGETIKREIVAALAAAVAKMIILGALKSIFGGGAAGGVVSGGYQGGVAGASRGGIIGMAGGGFVPNMPTPGFTPMGTDSVIAALTPRELVTPESVWVPLLKSMKDFTEVAKRTVSVRGQQGGTVVKVPVDLRGAMMLGDSHEMARQLTEILSDGIERGTLDFTATRALNTE